MSDAVWVLGTSMTRFGRYPELDAVDLASRACMDALADGGVTIHDMDVMGAGTLFQSQTGMGQRVQKQIGQTGIPVYNVTNACATGATAIRTVYLSIKAGEAQMGLAFGVEQMGKMGLLRGGAKAEDVIAYAECAAAQYALIRGFGFARHVRTQLDESAGNWRADAVYTISPALPEGLRTIDAEVTVQNCGLNGIPTV